MEEVAMVELPEEHRTDRQGSCLVIVGATTAATAIGVLILGRHWMSVVLVPIASAAGFMAGLLLSRWLVCGSRATLGKRLVPGAHELQEE